MKLTIKTREDITVRDYLAQDKGAIELVAAMADITIEEAKAIPAKAFTIVKEACENELKAIPAYDPRRVIVGKQEWAIHPDFDEFEAGAMIDITQADEDDPEAYHTAILSAIFRKVTARVGNKYDVEPYTGKQHPELLDMPMKFYRGAEAFFLTISNELRQTTLRSLEKEVKEMTAAAMQ